MIAALYVQSAVGDFDPEATMKTVEKDKYGDWIARCPFCGGEILEPGWRWNTRASARDVVRDARARGRCYAKRDESGEHLRRAAENDQS